jgi:hypothetical protein
MVTIKVIVDVVLLCMSLAIVYAIWLMNNTHDR